MKEERHIVEIETRHGKCQIDISESLRVLQEMWENERQQRVKNEKPSRRIEPT